MLALAGQVENGGGGKSVIFPEKGAVLFRAGNVLGMQE